MAAPRPGLCGSRGARARASCGCAELAGVDPATPVSRCPLVWAAISVAAAVLVFVALALVLARRGLHRTLETMPTWPGERVLAEARGVTLVFDGGRGARSRVTYPDCTVRVTTSRLLVAQSLGPSGPDRLLSLVLSPEGERGMRSVDAEAIDRTLKSFSVGRVVPGSLAPTPEGGLAVAMQLIGPAIEPPRPPRWELPVSAASTLGPALRAAGIA